MKSIEKNIMAIVFVITTALGCEAILCLIENVRLWRKGFGEPPTIVKCIFKTLREKEC